MSRGSATQEGETRSTEESAARQEIEREKRRGNFVRAAHLAAVSGADAEQVRALQRAALRQFIAEYRNFDAAALLIREYGLNHQEIQEIISEVMAGPEAAVQTFCFIDGKPTSLTVADQVKRFAAQHLQARSGSGPKLLSLFSRLIRSKSLLRHV